MLRALYSFYRKWQLRRAQENYAYYKAKHEALRKTWASNFQSNLPAHYSEICALEAKYMERVEVLLRDQ